MERAQSRTKRGLGTSSTSAPFPGRGPVLMSQRRHVRTKKTPVQPIPTFEQLIELIMEVGRCA